MLGSQEEAIMAANTEGEDGVVADFELEDEVFKELAPHKDPDVLVCFDAPAALHGPEAVPSRRMAPMLVPVDTTCVHAGQAGEELSLIHI